MLVFNWLGRPGGTTGALKEAATGIEGASGTAWEDFGGGRWKTRWLSGASDEELFTAAVELATPLPLGERWPSADDLAAFRAAMGRGRVERVHACWATATGDTTMRRTGWR